MMDSRTFFARALFAYGVFLTAVVTLSPFVFAWPPHQSLSWHFGWFDFMSNMVLFFPLGFLLRVGLDRGPDPALFRAFMLGCIVSSAFEALQYLSPGRNASPWDVLANGLGTWMGAVAHHLAHRGLWSRLGDGLALRLPLMTLVYLASPLLWLNARASNLDHRRLILSLPLGVLASIVIATVWRHWLRGAGRIGLPAASALGGAWFLAASLLALPHHPDATLGAAMTVAILIGLQGALPLRPWHRDRRFELGTILKIAPIYAAYLLGLALWPIPFEGREWQATWKLPNFPDNPGLDPILRLLELVTAFTLLGYMAAEARGRRQEPVGRAVGVVICLCIGAAAILETLSGFHPQQVASFLEGALAVAAGGFGAWIYRLQLAAFQASAAGPRGRPVPLTPHAKQRGSPL